jgi:hypothetical protein
VADATHRWVLLLLAACLVIVAPASARSGSSGTSPLHVSLRLTPHFRVLGYETSGFYPKFDPRDLNLRRVNSALTRTILADQRAFLPEARRQRQWLNSGHPRPGDPYRTGSHRTTVYPELTSASTLVVSTLLQIDRSAFVGQPGSHGWLSLTFQVPSGRRVSVEQLFRDDHGLRVFGNAWRESLDPQRKSCVDGGFFGKYSPTSTFFRNFALTPTGLAAAVVTSGACGSWWSIVPYARLRPYLSPLGARLIAGVRKASISRTHQTRGSAVVSVRVLPDQVELWPDRFNTVTSNGRLTVRATVDAEGARWSDARLTVTLTQGASHCTKSARIGPVVPGREKSAVVLFETVKYGKPAVVEVRVRSWSSRGIEGPPDHASYAVSLVHPPRLRTEGERGLGVVTVRALPQRLTLLSSSINVVTPSTGLRFGATIQNTGRYVERNIKVSLTIAQTPIIRLSVRIAVIRPDEQRRVALDGKSLSRIQYYNARAVPLRVSVTRLRGEADVGNNAAVYPVVFDL